MGCDFCDKLTKWYRDQNLGRHERVICEMCYEKSKEHSVYLDMSYKPEDDITSRMEWLINNLHKDLTSMKEIVDDLCK